MNEANLQAYGVGIAPQMAQGDAKVQSDQPPLMVARNMIAECIERIGVAQIEVDRISTELFGEKKTTEGHSDNETVQPRSGQMGALRDTIGMMFDSVGKLESEIKHLAGQLQ